ncbi:hypothetical protein [Polynucleobacter arcticus]|uniref:Glycosyltransferase RgtA/B/C/D-like domain-containing protein n=1 Tax=Polynucleobacter arcticus TaxID=1743165 RepID=A0A6M9PVT7_9BURK|nr:hypothetical protein [Polynucleobacter arcticus]QKM60083.1 hypothetical protein DN92_02980 [Polynucleobacter arcticus]
MNVDQSLGINTPLKFKGINKAGFSWPLIIGLFAFFYALLNQNSQFLDDPDSFMHIAAGNWMMAHQLVPSFDPFSFNTEGKVWIAHEWLAQVIWALVYNWGGFGGVKIFTAFLFALTLGLQLRYFLRYLPPIYGLLFSFLCYLSLLTHLLARPHLLTWPIIIIWFTTLITASANRSKPSFALLPLMVLWANLHGSFLLGLVLIPFIAIDAVIYCDKEDRVKNLLLWGLFFLLSVLASLITPYGLDGWKFGVDLMSSPYLTGITEWAPAFGSNLIVIELWVMAFLVIGYCGNVRLSIGGIVILLALFHEAIAHVRYISIFGLLAPILMAQPYAKGNPGKLLAGNVIDQFFIALSAPAKKVTMIFTLIVFGLLAVIYQASNPIVLNPKIAPIEALKKVQELGITGNVFNSYEFGGFLIFKGIPSFIDGRADLHGTPENNDYYKVTDSVDSTQITSVLDTHAIQWALMRPIDKFAMYFEFHPSWKQVFKDETSVIYVRQPS